MVRCAERAPASALRGRRVTPGKEMDVALLAGSAGMGMLFSLCRSRRTYVQHDHRDFPLSLGGQFLSQAIL